MTGINDLFDLTIGGEIVLSASCLATPIFRRIWENHEDKDLARREIEYIIFKHYWSTPYHIYGGPEDREPKVKQSLFDDPNYEISDVAKQSEIEYAEELQTSEVIQLLESARIGIRYMSDAFKSLKDNLTNPNDVVRWTKELGAMALSIDTVERKAKTNELNTSKTKGDREVRAYEIPNKKNI
jgi:hypothetical protein